MRLLLVLLFLTFTSPAWATTICNDGICREVETRPIVREFKQNISSRSRQPKYGVKRRVADWKWWLVNGISVTSSIIATESLDRCREDHGIGPCVDGEYGPFKQREALRQALTGGLLVASYEIKKIEDNDGSKVKFWWIFPVGNAAVNFGLVTQNDRKHYGPKVD